jgi:hypothetical protein
MTRVIGKPGCLSCADAGGWCALHHPFSEPGECSRCQTPWSETFVDDDLCLTCWWADREPGGGRDGEV